MNYTWNQKSRWNISKNSFQKKLSPMKHQYFSVSKGVHKQKLFKLQKTFVTCKNYILFSKKNTPMLTLSSQSSAPWDPNGVFGLAQKWLTLFVSVALIKQNFLLLVDAIDWDVTYKDRIKKITWNTESNKCMTHQCESCSGTATLKEFIDQEFNETWRWWGI